LLAGRAAAGLPEEGDCPALGGRPGDRLAEDAVPSLIREGMLLTYTDLVMLRDLIPAEVWRNRNVFFFDGMRMEIGPCHRRYPVPSYFAEATAQFSGRANVDDEGNLWGYVAGMPFPPESIAADDPAAGVKWAWNLELRNRGAGPHGHFRITDMPSRMGGTQTYTGDFFQLRTRHRADLPDTEFSYPGSDENIWVGGGSFDEPFEARHLAWRQMRPVEAERRYSHPDNTFVYVPTMRKVRRSATAWVDGMYTPRYRVGGDWGGGSIATGSNGLVPTGAVSPNSALSAAVTEHLPAGFNDFSLRPNAYVWRVLGKREVLAPINATRSGYPYEPDRNFGASGLSVGSDRWEVRYALVIEGAAKTAGLAFDSITIYVDHQTSLPLYLITRRKRGLIVDVGIPVHRFSGDVVDYPNWPRAEQRAQLFDPVAAVYFHAADGGSGWRRESFDVRSIPPPNKSLRKMTTTDTLVRGH
jgi:hypothetical protein